jgi:prepilin signal peptidase PulO-like enzyme (type II secretory pathway)
MIEKMLDERRGLLWAILLGLLCAVITRIISPVHPFQTWCVFLFLGALILVFITDAATQMIASWQNLLAFLAVLALDLAQISDPSTAYPLIGGTLLRSYCGAIIGILLIEAIRVGGTLLFREEAMGMGDVTLARALGAALFIQPLTREFPILVFLFWILCSCILGIVGAVLFYPKRAAVSAELQQEKQAGVKAVLRSDLRIICQQILLGDLFDYCRYLSGKKVTEKSEEPLETTRWALPFGPCMIVSFFITSLWGTPIVGWYVRYAGLA